MLKPKIFYSAYEVFHIFKKYEKPRLHYKIFLALKYFQILRLHYKIHFITPPPSLTTFRDAWTFSRRGFRSVQTPDKAFDASYLNSSSEGLLFHPTYTNRDREGYAHDWATSSVWARGRGSGHSTSKNVMVRETPTSTKEGWASEIYFVLGSVGQNLGSRGVYTQQ